MSDEYESEFERPGSPENDIDQPTGFSDNLVNFTDPLAKKIRLTLGIEQFLADRNLLNTMHGMNYLECYYYLAADAFERDQSDESLRRYLETKQLFIERRQALIDEIGQNAVRELDFHLGLQPARLEHWLTDDEQPLPFDRGLAERSDDVVIYLARQKMQAEDDAREAEHTRRLLEDSPDDFGSETYGQSEDWGDLGDPI